MSQIISPQRGLKAFNCVHCSAFAHQEWFTLYYVDGGQRYSLENFSISICRRCEKPSVWYWSDLVFPNIVTAPPCHADAPEDVKEDFEEARQIAAMSPRGAAALLRLALQKLMVDLGEKGDNIHNDIGNLVAKGLPVAVQQALDSVRVIGNNMVHPPGVLNVDDTPELVNRMFSLLNFIVDNRITQPRKLAELYGSLPETTLEGIKKRDSKPT